MESAKFLELGLCNFGETLFMSSREILRKKAGNSRISTQTSKGRGTITTWRLLRSPIFLLYCTLIYMLSILCVTLTIKVKVGIPESLKVGWYRQKITGSSHLKFLIFEKMVLHLIGEENKDAMTSGTWPHMKSIRRGRKNVCGREWPGPSKNQAILSYRRKRLTTFITTKGQGKNKIQEAVINIVNLCIVYNLTFRMLVNIHFQKWPLIVFTTIYIIVKRGSGTTIKRYS